MRTQSGTSTGREDRRDDTIPALLPLCSEPAAAACDAAAKRSAFVQALARQAARDLWAGAMKVEAAE
jgi:hypothetical protein